MAGGDGSALDVVTWNLGRPPVDRFRDQLAALSAVEPDILAVQELGRRTSARCAELLRAAGYPHVVLGRSVADRQPSATDVAVASRHPLEAVASRPYDGPRPHRVVTATARTPTAPVRVHAVHVVPGTEEPWTRVRMLEAVADALSVPAPGERLCCGDCNAPRAETRTDVVPFGDDPAARAAERGLLGPAATHGLRDAYRAVVAVGDTDEDYSFETGGERYRFDHVLASPGLVPTAATYRHEHDALSDHTPLHVRFDYDPVDD